MNSHRLPKSRRRKRLVVGVVIVLAFMIGGAVFSRLGEEFPEPSDYRQATRYAVVAVFGATGAVGDGVLEAVMADRAVERIHVVTRRGSARIDAGAASGRLQVTTHTDYRDYASLRPILAEVDAVYWALGTSAMNVTDEEYTAIHVDFPVSLVREWLAVRGPEAALSFHLVSGMGASRDSWSHWAREKARAEEALVGLANGTGLRVVSYRPGMIIPSKDRRRFHHGLAGGLVPLKLAIESAGVGRAMLEVSARGGQVASGTILENRDLLRYRNAYLARTR